MAAKPAKDISSGRGHAKGTPKKAHQPKGSQPAAKANAAHKKPHQLDEAKPPASAKGNQPEKPQPQPTPKEAVQPDWPAGAD